MPKGYHRMQVGQIVTYIKKHPKDRGWHDALRACQSEGASLVKMDSSKKQKLVDRKFPHFGRVYMWIGLNDVFQNDTFYWTDGERLTNIEAWIPGEPSLVAGGMDEDCVESRHGHKYMNDIPCHLLRSYLCEIDPLK
ncbi:CD209 antigen-like protein E [Haliotis rufescens]|uniref:CD209 antigen-like protein E n=1 Tax=Haliotis rufescens TaxID=6454 RepID=UPI00201E8865|nr:CD209 antigen-like protein E [Haliotis rufescens]